MARTEEQIYKVHSGVRKVHTRLQRKKAAGRHRFVQRLAGGDIVVRRVRPATITGTQLRQHLAEFKRARDEGRAEVRTPTGQLVDLDTLKPVAGLPAAPPKPEPPLDSAANDKTFPAGVGEHRPKYPEGKGQAEDAGALPSITLPGDESETKAVKSGGDPAAARKKSRGKKGK